MASMNVRDAEAIIARKVDRFWVDRALEMLHHLTISNTVITTVSKLRVAGDWPLRGSITFTRDHDGRRCRMWLNRKSKKFKAEAKKV